MIRAGLFLYDHLTRRVSLPGAESFATAGDPRAAAPFRPEITSAFAYSDAWVEDSRSVVLNARDAARRGARVLVRTALVSARRGADAWTCTLRAADGAEQEVRARALVNAAGPWVEQALGIAGVRAVGRVRLVRGSHVVLPALYEGEHAFILQNDDNRVVFVIPYEGAFSLVGTTDVPHESDPAEPRCTGEGAAYLCAAVGRQFSRAPRTEEIVWRFSGVRPLHDDGAGALRVRRQDHHLPPPRGGGDGPPGRPPRRRAHTLDGNGAAAGGRPRRPRPPRLRTRHGRPPPLAPAPAPAPAGALLRVRVGRRARRRPSPGGSGHRPRRRLHRAGTRMAPRRRMGADS
ncbi:MAG: Aerobic glycerol-3-phosphate dehydrogenase [uncultured Acetobacteraceae bacterium]|uniref:Aerobic glycerol-3-phosphate dehydrogenase n=1 Tax=uncultured Acetobacteraceae bacterium TaxID=169975 RepID=A0A6J4IYP7_9PROT|nr:MAG: Aerobic glycerol-3-phosphate dehydrogenase [uncultured Acetobacteraceae bacterium]